MKKVMFVSSAGGHLAELLKLSPLFIKYDYVLITEKVKTSEILKNKYNVEFVIYGSRYYFLKYIFVFIANVFLAFKYILKYRPEVIVTTGAHTGGVFCYIGKLFGAKTIYIESMAKVSSLSMTGNFMYKRADKFYVQWEDLEKKYDKAKYIGRLI